jgi:hypothetical protein
MGRREGVALEDRKWPREPNGLMPERVRYSDWRDDWIKGADLVVRSLARSVRASLVLEGFPRQWIPLFIHFGVAWDATSDPQTYIPFASDLSQEQLVELCLSAQKKGASRELAEAFASLDPLLGDVLYKLDRRRVEPAPAQLSRLGLTGWQSYGRPEVQALDDLVRANANAKHATAVLLPCARKRPYEESKTHRRIWKALAGRGIAPDKVDHLVISSIGIVPQALWSHPVVLAYDSGVPDIYRVLRLMREFFRNARYETAIDCLEFKPYSDCLLIAQREGLIGTVQKAMTGRARQLPQP